MHGGLAECKRVHLLQVAEIVLKPLKFRFELAYGHMFDILLHELNYSKE
jgi:hypothetical protein